MTNQPFATPSFGRPTTWTPTSSFGRYTIERQLGLGGMAQIWRARVGGESGFVVLKTALPHLAADPAFSAMFVREAALSIQFSHPNIVAVQDIGAIDGRFFIEMEYVLGRTLRQLLRRATEQKAQLPLDFVLAVMIDCCNALDYVHSFCDLSGHSQGLVHRDFSPENVMVSASGLTKLLDFGIVSSEVSSKFTQVGQLKGKMHYMAPEVFRGARPDPQRDIYALGVTLFELVTGRRPFDAKNDAELMYKISNEAATPPSALRKDLPDALESLIKTAIAKRPQDRFDSVRQLRTALRTVAEELEPMADHACVAETLARYFPNIDAEDPGSQDLVAADSASAPSSPSIPSNRSSISHYTEPPPRVPLSRARSATFTPIPSAASDLFSTSRPRPRNSYVSRVDIFTSPQQRVMETNPFALYGRSEIRETPTPSDSFLPMEPEPPAPRPARQAIEHFERGLAYQRSGQVRDALDEWERAAELDPNNATFRTNVRLARLRLDTDSENNQR